MKEDGHTEYQELMSVSGEGRWSHTVADSVLECPQSVLLKFQRSVGVVGMYSTKAEWWLIIGQCCNFGKFSPNLQTGWGNKLFTSHE